jgi:hypothetical protein
MQEQLPLRPAEFVKIRDGFIAFLKQPAGTPIEHVVPQAVIDTMVMAAQRGRSRRRMLDIACGVSVLVAAIGAIIGIVIEPMIIGIMILLIGGAVFIGAINRRKIRSELEIDELVTGPNEALQRNLRALDDFRNLIANGDLTCEEHLPDGSVKQASALTLRAFRADHGGLLVLSRDQGIWQCIPHRPIPLSALWVRLGGRVAPAFVTSRGLLDTSDRRLFDLRIEWLLSHADQANHRAHSFREAIQIIVALRRPDLDELTFERKKELLCAEGFGESRMEKIHAGIYPAFNNFLRTLPMHEFP